MQIAFTAPLLTAQRKTFGIAVQKELSAANLPFHARRDSDKRSQLIANLDDIIEAFDVLDSSDLIPPIYCEANDLLFLPPLCLDPTSEQIQQNTKILQNLVSQVEIIEKKFSTVCPGSQCAASFSYAQAASTPPDPHVNVASPSPARLSSVKTTSVTVPRACKSCSFWPS